MSWSHRFSGLMDDFTFDPGLSKPFAELKGRLVWPVKGKSVKRFGAESASGRRDGVLIEAEEGADVYAVGHGRIAYAATAF